MNHMNTVLVGAGVLAVGVMAMLALLAVQVMGRLHERRHLRRATLLARQGNETGAIQSLLRAESAWSFNTTSGSRRASVRDLERLEAIVRLLDTTYGHGRAAASTLLLLATIHEMRSLLECRANFGWDGRSMRADTALRWATLMEHLKTSRADMRQQVEAYLSVKDAGGSAGWHR
jgi:hypothetical protein